MERETARLEAFSDGIFAIAATLLILEVHPRGEGTLTHQLLHAWGSYLAYAIAFATIGIMWINHHAIFGQVARVDRTFLAINVLFLMVIAFIPFPTRVLAEHLHGGDARAATVFYGITNILMAAMFGAVWFSARGRRLLAADADPRVVAGISRSFRPGVPVYALATASSFVSPWLALAIYGAVALFYLLESTLLVRS